MSRINKQLILVLLLIIAISSIILFIPEAYSANTVYDNYRNVSVTTRVNITNAKPEILTIVVYQETNSTIKNITLSAGSTRKVTCNASVRDWDGYNDIVGVNATLWDLATSTSADSDNNNRHYTNATCTQVFGSGYLAEYICTFDVYYYSNNGTWVCNATIIDDYNKTGWKTNTTIVYPLYALNLTDGIDYGNVAVEDFSISKTANITNFGNMAINVSIEGYGVTRGDGLAMNCSINGNISVDNERFSLTNSGNTGADWLLKIPATTTTQLIPNLTMSKQTIPGSLITNATYWQLYIEPNPSGNCSGFILFSAQLP